MTMMVKMMMMMMAGGKIMVPATVNKQCFCCATTMICKRTSAYETRGERSVSAQRNVA